MNFHGSPGVLALLLATATLGATGCGNNFDLILLRSAEATGRTFLDIFLTDLANTLSQQAADSPDDEGDDDTNNQLDNDNGTGDGSSLDDLVGEPVNGQSIYVDNGCGGCHCDDASGGCALEAPPIADIITDVLDAFVRGSSDHPVKIDITDQELADMQAYLASL